THDFAQPNMDWALENERPAHGTFVLLSLNNHTSRSVKKIFDEYASKDGDYSFSKTVVPLELARYGNEQLVSRSHAKRVLSRVDLFKTVLLDFKGVSAVGQGFADEIFRVFPQDHPQIELIPINANEEVRRMIHHVQIGDAFTPFLFPLNSEDAK